MKIFRWENNKLKFFNITLFKISKNKKGVGIYILGICTWLIKNNITRLAERINNNSDFDMKNFDDDISKLITTPTTKLSGFSENKIAYLATELYETGGHTKCIKSLIKSMANDYNQCLFITRLDITNNNAKKEIKAIEKFSKIDGANENYLFFNKQVFLLYNKIVNFGAKTLFVFIHPDDITATAVISLIKKTTNIKIIFFNHASHYPCLGMTFSDLILEGMPSTLKITNEKRHLYNTKIIGLQSLEEGETKYYSKEELTKVREDFRIRENELMTISGGDIYKFFEESSSEYFEMIKELLQNKQNLKHIIMINLDKRHEKIIDNIFSYAEEERKRLIITPLSKDYEKFFQAADLYIDSFPVSSALTQIDLMRLKVASIVKINKEKPEWSFHEYMPPNYPYMFESVEDFKNGIIDLLDNPQKREALINENYNYWLNTYESNCVKQKYIKYMNEILDDIKLENFLNVDYELQMETRNWRNSKNVAKYFKIPYIEENVHKQWLDSLQKTQPVNIAYIIKYKNSPIGVTYFHSIDYEKKTCDWGIYIYNESYRGMGIGDKTLKRCINIAKELEMKYIFLEVLSTNTKAKILYENNGFKLCKTLKNDKFLRYEKELL